MVYKDSFSTFNHIWLLGKQSPLPPDHQMQNQTKPTNEGKAKLTN